MSVEEEMDQRWMLELVFDSVCKKTKEKKDDTTILWSISTVMDQKVAAVQQWFKVKWELVRIGQAWGAAQKKGFSTFSTVLQTDLNRSLVSSVAQVI